MLTGLSIRNFVLIDRLDLSLHKGLCVFTGETGAGKSILLGAIGLSLGERASPTLLRPGTKQGSVAAEFLLPPDDATQANPTRTLLAEAGLAEACLAKESRQLILRRVFSADGKSRAFINDTPVSVSTLQTLGASLVEIQGQFENRGLLNPATHRKALDSFGDYDALRHKTAAAFNGWKQAEDDLAEAQRTRQAAAAQEESLRQYADELSNLAPQQGEEKTLSETREWLRHGEQLVEALQQAKAALGAEKSVEDAIGLARKSLERQAENAKGKFDPILASLASAALEIMEAENAIAQFGDAMEADPGRLDEAEERLFALRAAARKHGVEVDALPRLCDEFKATLQALDVAAESLRKYEIRVSESRDAYLQTASDLRKARSHAAKRLDQAIAKELAPIKLEKAVFRTTLRPLEEARFTEQGMDRIVFEGAMNPGAPLRPLAKVASGGELARLMLALKVVLSHANPVPSLIFDEVDSGIGGAVATAVGERLARLGNDLQILVITHSPQVAAIGAHHWRVHKSAAKAGNVTNVEELSQKGRREEIARMLAGAEVTDEARAAADQLLRAQKP
ncbi:DNA repair protein RecN [Rhodospirillaceae bacterium AH-315-P19]|nr:DNA repair protein RecN [Rhodospirillaceae bacterium AH-315-P19]